MPQLPKNRPFVIKHRITDATVIQFKNKRVYSPSGKKFGFVRDVVVYRARNERAERTCRDNKRTLNVPKLVIRWTDKAITTEAYATGINLHQRKDGHYQLN